MLCFLGPNQLVCWINDDSALPILHIRIHILIWEPIHQQMNDTKKRKCCILWNARKSDILLSILKHCKFFVIITVLSISLVRNSQLIFHHRKIRKWNRFTNNQNCFMEMYLEILYLLSFNVLLYFLRNHLQKKISAWNNFLYKCNVNSNTNTLSNTISFFHCLSVQFYFGIYDFKTNLSLSSWQWSGWQKL